HKIMTRLFQRTYPPTLLPSSTPALWFLFRGSELLVQEQDRDIALFHGLEEDIAFLHPRSLLYFGTLRGVPCIASGVAVEEEVPEGWRAIGLRTLFGQLDEISYGLAGYALHLLYWEDHSRYCPACATPLEAIPGGWGRRCPNGDYQGYPPVTPAVLVLIHDGDRILLTHKPGWGPRHSIIAGFVEPGETLEQCVRREVFEEVGVEVDTITYVGSQPWPYPDQMMIGFTVRYAGGLVQPDQQELDAATWFTFATLPHLPAPSSLSYQMITGWAESRRIHLQKSDR
ncbi:MAG TPA: NAD(+) diphosphatase, partial [Ktedonobacteraceae bacterium]